MHSLDQEKTGATIFLNRMGLPLVVPQCEGGGRSTRRNLCAAAAVLVVLCLGPHVHCHRCEWSGDANGQAMQMVMRRGIAAIVHLQLAERNGG